MYTKAPLCFWDAEKRSNLKKIYRMDGDLSRVAKSIFYRTKPFQAYEWIYNQCNVPPIRQFVYVMQHSSVILQVIQIGDLISDFVQPDIKASFLLWILQSISLDTPAKTKLVFIHSPKKLHNISIETFWCNSSESAHKSLASSQIPTKCGGITMFLLVQLSIAIY